MKQNDLMISETNASGGEAEHSGHNLLKFKHQSIKTSADAHTFLKSAGLEKLYAGVAKLDEEWWELHAV